MEPRQLVILALQASIFCIVFGFGLKASVADLLYLARQPGLLVRSLLAVFVIVPVLAVGLVLTFDLRPTLKVALIAVSISPVPPLLPRKGTNAGGDRAYGISLMATLALLAIVTVPLLAAVMGRIFDQPLGASPGAIAPAVVMAALLPLFAGTAVRSLLPAIAKRIERPVSRFGLLLAVLALVVLLGATWQAVWAAVGDGTILVLVVFVVASLLVGHLLGGPNSDESIVLALSSACRHPAIALTIAASSFPGEEFVGTILLYLIVSAIVCAPYLAWQRDR
jgi:BASS family bile acid:Na+ symporter